MSKAPLLPLFGALALSPIQAQNDLPTYGLPEAPGRDLVLANCMACHSGAIVAANHLSRERWDALIDQMREKNGMWELTPETRSAILDYLEAHQRPDAPGLDAAKVTPWASPLYQPNPIW